MLAKISAVQGKIPEVTGFDSYEFLVAVRWGKTTFVR
jgi:hypothetical protein